jgi:sodium-dependent phosphate transporter
VSSIAGVGVAAVGADNVQWGWNNGSGLGAIFAGLCIAPLGSGAFASIIFMLIKLVVHVRKDPLTWAVYTSPAFFLIAGTVCTLSIVYRGSPSLNLDEREPWYIAAVSLGVGFGLFILAGLFFVPYVHTKVVKKDYTLKIWHIFQGPLLFRRVPQADAVHARVPNYAVIQHGGEADHSGGVEAPNSDIERASEPSKDNDNLDQAAEAKDMSASDQPKHDPEDGTTSQTPQQQYQALLKKAREQHHAHLRTKRGPLGWAMRVLHKNPLGAGSIYELHNLRALCVRFPAYIVVALLYGVNYDIHRAQVGVLGTPEGRRMDRVYKHVSGYLFPALSIC